VEPNEEIIQLPSINLTREERESSEGNKIGEFVGDIKTETKKEKKKEIVQEQEQQGIKNNEIVQLRWNKSFFFSSLFIQSRLIKSSIQAKISRSIGLKVWVLKII
jgi:hypothetical protein